MIMNNDWDALFDQEIQKEYLLNLRYFLAREYKTKQIFPAKENIFAAFKTTSLKDTKVVILGQDPYHNVGQAQGYAFSVPSDFPLPPSLKNIYKELENKWYDILLMAISCNKYNDNRQLEKKKEVVEQIKNVYLMEYKELAKCMNKLGL